MTSPPARVLARNRRPSEPALRDRRLGAVQTLALLLAATVALAACDTGVGPPQLPGRTFLSTARTQAGADFPLLAGTQIRLTFGADGQLGASAGCNSIGGSYRVTAGRLTFEGGGMTEMGCDPPRHEQDDWLATFLSSGPTVRLSGSDLVLTAGDVAVVLVDVEVAAPDLALRGPVWTVDGIVAGQGVSSVPLGASATIQFDADRVSVNTGCNSAGGTLVVEPNTLTVTELAITRRGCEGAALELERAVLAALPPGEAVSYSIDGPRLTLAAGDRGLILVAR